MHARSGLSGFVLAILGIAVAYGSAFLPGGPPPWAPWLMSIATALSMVSAMVLGAARAGQSLGALRWIFATVFVLISGGFCLALGLGPTAGLEPIWLGLPRRAAILIYGIGLFPVILLPIAYALTFDQVTLSEHDLARFRERLAALRSNGSRRDMR